MQKCFFFLAYIWKSFKDITQVLNLQSVPRAAALRSAPSDFSFFPFLRCFFVFHPPPFPFSHLFPSFLCPLTTSIPHLPPRLLAVREGSLSLSPPPQVFLLYCLKRNGWGPGQFIIAQKLPWERCVPCLQQPCIFPRPDSPSQKNVKRHHSWSKNAPLPIWERKPCATKGLVAQSRCKMSSSRQIYPKAPKTVRVYLFIYCLCF